LNLNMVRKIWDRQMKKEDILLIILIIVFIGSLFFSFVDPNVVDSDDNQNTTNIVYSDEYKESVRENVIIELYGSRESYASEKTGSRADYVDKESSKDGELVIDEDRKQQVYESKLKEFDSMIDNEKVDEIVAERLEQLVDEGAYNNLAESNKISSRKVMYWKNGGKYYALIVEAVMILCLLYKRRKESK